MKRSIQVTRTEWLAGEATILKWETGGSSVQTYAETFIAGMVSVQRAERILAWVSAWEGVRKGVIEGVPVLNDFFAQKDIGGHLGDARLLADPHAATCYLAALGSMRGISKSGSWSQVASSRPLLQGAAQLGAFPFAVVAWVVVGVAASAAAAWWGADRNTKQAQVQVQQAAIAGQVSQYLKQAELAAATGQPIPAPPDIVAKVAAQESSGTWIKPAVGVAVGGVVLGGIWKMFTAPRATPVRVVNPSPLRRRRRAARSTAPARRRAAARPKRSPRVTSTKKSSAPKARPNPSHWENVSSGVYARGPYRIRSIGSKWAVIRDRKVVGESATLRGAKAIAGRKPRRALNPKSKAKKRTAKQRRGMLFEKKRNPKKKKAAKKRRNPTTNRRPTTKRTRTPRSSVIVKPRKNPIRAGYSQATVSKNIGELRRAGYNDSTAAAIALRSARAAWRRKTPKGAFPRHLETRAERAGNKRNPKHKTKRKSNPKRKAAPKKIANPRKRRRRNPSKKKK